MEKRYKPGIFFNLDSFAFKDIFNNSDYAWEVIPKIAEYLNLHMKNNSNQKVFIGEGTRIEEGAYIKGPAIIGKDCFIGHGAYIRENCILGENVHVGHAVEIKNSILLNGAVCSHFNYIGDSIIGSKSNIAAGAVLANVRLDKKPVILNTENHKIETGLKKFGSIIGDGSVVGANAVLNPGTVLGKNCIVYPVTSVVGVYGEGSLIK